MGKMMKLLGVLALASAVLIFGYLVLRGLSSLGQGYSWEEMDWAQKGSTSISDFFAASDIGKREILQGEKKCIEYFSYKDGLSVKVVCPK